MSFGTAYATKKFNKKCMSQGGDIAKSDRESNLADMRFKPTALAFGGPAEHKPQEGQDLSDDRPRGMDQMISNVKQKVTKSMAGMDNAMQKYKHEESPDVLAEADPVPVDDGKGLDSVSEMFARIMQKRKAYSKGGRVSNDVGVAHADELPAEYDDLVLDDHLEDDSGAGNEIDHGIIKKILAKRKK
jgi:hypothetical protein